MAYRLLFQRGSAYLLVTSLVPRTIEFQHNDEVYGFNSYVLTLEEAKQLKEHLENFIKDHET
ncbi:hypothetical protein [Flagellimonas marina]|uniref:DUF5659 domain-containing protein n=1 Tax=Flagellimonas marina TaxID=1775168 RepID=A0ABV8PGG1_9FLAO